MHSIELSNKVLPWTFVSLYVPQSSRSMRITAFSASYELDLYSRKVVGWSMSSRMKAELVCDALTMAIWQRRPEAGLIHHSDRGAQYASQAFRYLLETHGFQGSMSRKGNCWDNSVVESFFGSLKQERVQWRNYQTRHEAQQDILNYIAMFYNPHRLHSYLRYKSPNQYEAEMSQLQKVA